MEVSIFDRIKFHALVEQYASLKLKGQDVYYKGQHISAARSWDYKLLRHSFAFKGLIKREVMQIRFHLVGGEVIESKIFKGTKSSVSDYKSIMNTMLALELQAKKLGLGIVKAQIAHTHLSDCVVTDTKMKLCMLSESDLEIGRRLKQFRRFPIEIKAIAKDGLVFRKLF